MSYDCEIGLVLSQQGFQILKDEIAKAVENNDEKRLIFEEMQSCGRLYFRRLTPDRTDVFIYWTRVKWGTMQQLLELLESSVPVEHWRCFIIGDAVDDCEESGAYYDNEVNASIHREIIFPAHLLDDDDTEQFLIPCKQSDEKPE